ncbi:MAG: hypothetical protein H0W08_07420 [Acidobacteria bacterium]|nr:hypothetical protein [Acidobacteriota bacterium]
MPAGSATAAVRLAGAHQVHGVDLLRCAALEELEIVTGQVGHEPAIAVEHPDVHLDELHTRLESRRWLLRLRGVLVRAQERDHHAKNTGAHRRTIAA